VVERWMSRASLAVLAALLVLAAGPAAAEEWGTIDAGKSTMAAVRAMFGTPTRSVPQKIEGYDAMQWTYEGAQAPGGIRRMTVDFGLLTSAGYRGDVVRTFRLEPKPGAFTRGSVVNAYGVPNRLGREGEHDVFFYQSGLVVYFEKEAWNAHSLIFVPRQPAPPAPAAPR
jgi:hypothetical protein